MVPVKAKKAIHGVLYAQRRLPTIGWQRGIGNARVYNEGRLLHNDGEGREQQSRGNVGVKKKGREDRGSSRGRSFLRGRNWFCAFICPRLPCLSWLPCAVLSANCPVVCSRTRWLITAPGATTGIVSCKAAPRLAVSCLDLLQRTAAKAHYPMLGLLQRIGVGCMHDGNAASLTRPHSEHADAHRAHKNTYRTELASHAKADKPGVKRRRCLRRCHTTSNRSYKPVAVANVG